MPLCFTNKDCVIFRMPGIFFSLKEASKQVINHRGGFKRGVLFCQAPELDVARSEAMAVGI